jgi:uncharacterized protein with HEPN domain
MTARSVYARCVITQARLLRNRLIHGYDHVDFDILWEILTKDLPPLKATLDEIVATAKP